MEAPSDYLASLHADSVAFTNEHSLSEATVKSYRLVIRSNFRPWCDFYGIDPDEPGHFDDDLVAAYLVDRHDYPEVFDAIGRKRKPAKANTLGVELAAIDWHYKRDGGTSPVGVYSRMVLAGMQPDGADGKPPPNVEAMTADRAELIASLSPELRPNWIRTLVLVAHAAAAPLLQAASVEPEGSRRASEGWRLVLPEVNVGRGGHHVAPRRTVLVRPFEAELLCPVRALDALVADGGHLGSPPFGRPDGLADTIGYVRARIRAAATTAELPVALDPYPAAGMAAEDLQRLVCFLAPELLRFYVEQAYALWGASGAFRGDELSRMRYRDLDWFPDGVVAYLRTAKGDQQARGAVVYIPYAADPALCPVRLLQRWCRLAGIHGDRVLFPTIDGATVHWDRGIDVQAGRKAIRRFATQLGWEGRWATRSMRRGFAQSAAAAGEHLAKIAAALRHSEVDTTIRYLAPAKPADRVALQALKGQL